MASIVSSTAVLLCVYKACVGDSRCACLVPDDCCSRHVSAHLAFTVGSLPPIHVHTISLAASLTEVRACRLAQLPALLPALHQALLQLPQLTPARQAQLPTAVLTAVAAARRDFLVGPLQSLLWRLCCFWPPLQVSTILLLLALAFHFIIHPCP